MGNYNCKECIERDINKVNELLINNTFFSSETNEENNSRTKRLNEFKSKENEKENNFIHNVETDISLGKKSLVRKMKNKNETNQYSSKNLKKEEKENTILLKNELNKIKDININTNKEPLETNKQNKINNNNFDINLKNESEKIINKENLEQQKLIQSQKETILEQQKLIEQYKQQQLLYEQQHLQLQEAQLKIKEQQTKLENLESQNIIITSPQFINNEKNFKNSPNNLRGKKEIKVVFKGKTQNKKMSSSKSTPKIQKLSLNKQQLEYNQEIQSQEEPQFQNIQNPNEQIYVENPKIQYVQNVNNIQRINKYEPQENNNLDENNYERVEELEEVEDKMIHHYQSQKFKIETYEPIEQSNNNEIDNDANYENNLDNHNLNNNEDIYFKKEEKMEPEDTLKYGLRKPIIPKPNSNKYSSSDKNKGPKDSSGKKNGNFNFRGTFEGKSENNNDIKINEFGPGDSKRNTDKNESLHNINNDEALNSNENIVDLKHNINPITGAISNEILKNNNYDFQMDINGEINNKKNKYSYAKTKVIPMIKTNQINQNNGFYSNDEQKESPRFNEIDDTQNQQIFSGENNNPQNFQNIDYGTENQMQNYNYNMTSYMVGNGEINGTENVLFNKEKIVNESSYTPNIIQENNTYDMTNSEIDNPLLYSDDIGNMNYLEKKYAIYQNQLNINKNEEDNF